jgi:hypothetical protein
MGGLDAYFASIASFVGRVQPAVFRSISHQILAGFTRPTKNPSMTLD